MAFGGIGPPTTRVVTHELGLHFSMGLHVKLQGVTASCMVRALAALKVWCIHVLPLDVDPEYLSGTESFITQGAGLVSLSDSGQNTHCRALL